MRRVVVTGIGIVSSIGTDADAVTQSLRDGTSGIVAAPDYAELGFRSQVKGAVDIDLSEHIDRKQMRFMGEGAGYAVVAMQQAVADSGLSEAEVSHPRTGLIAGSGGPSTANLLAAADITREKGPKTGWPLHGAHAVCRRLCRPVLRLSLKSKVLITQFHLPALPQRIV